MKRIGIFCDLDGTLIDSQKRIADFDKAMVQRAIAKGYKFYIITGKSIINAQEYYDELNLDTFFISSMGQVISKPHDASFKPIVHPVDFHYCSRLFAAIDKEFGIRNYIVETLDDQFIVKRDNDSNLIKLITEGRKPKEYHGEKIENIIGSYAEVNPWSHQELLQKTKKLNEEWLNRFEFAFWMTDGNLPIIQMKPTHTGKSKAMKEVIALDQLDYTIAFGNGWSDRHMLEQADEGYAMLNSSDKVKSFARFVTAYDNNNAGVGHELQKILGDNLVD